MCTCTFVGKGAGSFVAGQLTLALDITQVFICIAVFGAFSSSCMIVVKILFGGKWERQVLEEKEAVIEQMKSVNGGVQGDMKNCKARHDFEYETSSL